MDATAAAQKHAFMLNLPEEVKLEMKCNGAEVGTMNYEELKFKAGKLLVAHFVVTRPNNSLYKESKH